MAIPHSLSREELVIVLTIAANFNADSLPRKYKSALYKAKAITSDIASGKSVSISIGSETDYLMSSPANAKRLVDSIDEFNRDI